MTINTAELTRLIELFRASEWNELHIELDGLQLFLSNDPDARLSNSGFASQHVVSAVPAPDRGNTQPAKTVNASLANAKDEEIDSSWTPILAPNLGTFYRAAKPGEPPFIEVGQAVEADTEVCLIEVMKLFTALKAGCKGIIKKVCVEDADLVEAGQVLFYVEAS
jgi:acetyl-CoA carboxylase biotin carboxyl carrier protein